MTAIEIVEICILVNTEKNLNQSVIGSDCIVRMIHIAYSMLSHDVVSGSDITPCNKIDKPLVVYRFCNIM